MTCKNLFPIFRSFSSEAAIMTIGNLFGKKKIPVVAMWGHLWGLDMTATTAMPDAVLMGLAFSLHSIQKKS